MSQACHLYVPAQSHSGEPRMYVGGQGTAALPLACLSSPFKATQTRSHQPKTDPPS